MQIVNACLIEALSFRLRRLQPQVLSSSPLPDTLLRLPRSDLLLDDKEVSLQDLWPRRPRQGEHREARGLEAWRTRSLPVPVLQKGSLIKF